MKIAIVSVGSKMPSWIENAYQDYVKRLPREYQIQLIEVKPEKRNHGMTAAKAMQNEAQRIERSVPHGYRWIVLDERGNDINSHDFAQIIKQWNINGDHIAFIIGGADGLHPTIKTRADKTIRLSALTLPHGLARVLLSEQIYRAISILNGHPYHRD